MYFTFSGQIKSPRSNLLKGFPFVSLPSTTDYFQVFVCSFDTPDHIWVQLVAKESLKLDMLSKELTKFYGALEDHERQLKQGTLVIS